MSSKSHRGEPPKKLVCLETHWGDYVGSLFDDTSVQPFLVGLKAMLDQPNSPFRLAHRHIDLRAQLSSYTNREIGLLWQDQVAFDVPIYYLAFHGAPGALLGAHRGEGLEPSQVKANPLIEAFRDWGADVDNLVYFAACSVMKGKMGNQFARDFLRESKCRAVVGYTTEVDWMNSMITDLLFLWRFYSNPDPWTNLRTIYSSVMNDFAPARTLGLTVFENRDGVVRRLKP